MNSKTKIKFLSFLITVTMLLSGMTFGVHAATEIGYEVSLSNSVTGIGKEVVLTVALTNYSAQSDQIRGLQIDIGNIDTDILSVVSYNSLIVDSSAVSNTASYSQNNSRVRLVYANFSGTLPVSNGEDGKMKVFEVKFKINSNLETDGQIELPVTVKIQTTSKQITLDHTVIVSYCLSHTHIPGEAADCEKDQICTLCGEILNSKLGHEYIETIVPASCTAQGYTKHVCSRCDHYYEDDYTDKENHISGNWIIDKEAEIGLAGEKHISCIKCGEVMETASIDPLPEESGTEPDNDFGIMDFIDSIADKIGVPSDQLLMVAGGSLAVLVLLIIVIAAIKRKRR